MRRRVSTGVENTARAAALVVRNQGSIRLKAYAPNDGGGSYPGVPLSMLRNTNLSIPVAKDSTRQRFGRSISLDRIETALKLAHIGNMQQLTDLSRETVETDPHLGAVLNKRFGAVSCLPYEVRPATGGGIDKEKALFYAAVVREQLQNLTHFRRTMRQLAWALFDGRAALEVLWTMVAGPVSDKFGSVRIAVVQTGWIHPRRLSFGPNRELVVTDEKLSTSGIFSTPGIVLDAEPAGKFLIWQPQLFGEYPEREGLAPRCMYWSFFKRYSQRDRMILLELFGKPWRLIEVEEESSASDEDLQAADDAADGLGAAYTARMPRGTKLTVVQPGKSAGEVHKEVIDDADKQISKLVLGQTGTTDGMPAGLNSSQASVMQDEQLMILTSDAAELSEIIETQLTDRIIAANFGESELPHAPTFALRSDLPADRKAEVERLKGALDSGLEISLAEAYEITGFRQPERIEAILKVEQPPMSPLAPVAPAPRPIIVWPDGSSPSAGEQQPIAPIASTDEGARDDTGISIGSADQATIMTVNEARAGQGLQPLTLPDGSPDPDGDLTITEFESKKIAISKATEEAAPAQEGALPILSGPVQIAAAENVYLMIRQVGGEWCVYSHDGSRKFGCYSSEQAAEERLREIENFKHMEREPEATDGDIIARGLAAELATNAELETIARYNADECVCCARQPESVNGSLESIFEDGTPALQGAVNDWADQLASAFNGLSDASSIANAANRASMRLSARAFAEPLEKDIVRSLALGALDSAFDEGGTPVEQAKFAAIPPFDPKFVSMPFDKAMAYFKARNVVTKASFIRLSAIAKRKAFTVAALTQNHLLQQAHAELARLVGKGTSLRDFATSFKSRLQSAGVIASSTKAQTAYVQTVFRTNVLGAYNTGRYARQSQPVVMKALPYWQIRTISDNRRRPNHAQADGVILKATDPFWQRGYPPLGFNCFLPGTAIEGKISGGSKAFYSGQAVELITAVGRRLSVTANHPVVTTRGLIPASSICEHDYLLCNRDQSGIASLSASAQRYKEQAPAVVEDIFHALSQRGSSHFSSYSPDDFHGEASRFAGNINVVGSYRELLTNIVSTITNEIKQFVFKTTAASQMAFMRFGLLDLGFEADGLTATRIPRSRTLALDSSVRIADRFPLESFSFGSSSEFDTLLGKNASDRLSADSVFIRQMLDRYSGAVFLDEVVGVRKFDFSGHVFDLESPFGWIAANGIYTSNCRCRVVSLSAQQASGMVISSGAAINYIPDPGFTAGPALMLASFWHDAIVMLDAHAGISAERAAQTLIFDKSKFETVESALNWAKAHGFEHYTSRETDNMWRVRQRPPEDFKPGSMRTIEIEPGISLIDGELI